MSFAAPYDRKTIEDALHSWLVFASDLLEASIVVADQAVPQPVHPYATFRIALVSRMGGDDERRDNVDMRRDEGFEVESNLCGLRRGTVSVNFYARADTATGDAMAYGASAQAALAKDEVIEMLKLAGVSVVDEGQLRDLSQLESSEWISRCQFDVGICFASNLAEYVGFIETVIVDAPFIGINEETVTLETE